MDALVARADAIRPLTKRKRKLSGTPALTQNKSKVLHPRSSKGKAGRNTRSEPSLSSAHDPTLASIARRTAVPHTLLPPSGDPLAAGTGNGKPKDTKAGKDPLSHIADRKLKARLHTQRALAVARAAEVADAERLLPGTAPGHIAVTEPLERTWRLTQADLVKEGEGVGREAAAGRRELALDGGGSGFRTRWTRNGRHMALVGRKGRLASVDWMTGGVHAEVYLNETCRDVTYLHSHHHVAVAQARHAFIYDQDLVELHRLSALIEPAFLEFLPYHWLLVCAGLPGTLSYLDTSTGAIVAQHRPKLGRPTALTQNAHNAVVYWGAGDGTVTLWSPSSTTPHVRLLAHLGPIAALSVDPSSGGRYLATGGMDGRVKVWDSRNYASPVREWSPRSGAASALEWSQRGVLAVAAGGTVNTYTSPTIQSHHPSPALPPLFLTHPLPSGAKPASSLRFQPFQDVLAIGHAKGISSILIPGSGEPKFDSTESDPFESSKQRAEREVRSLLDKIQPDMITLDPNFVGSLAPASKLTYANANANANAAGAPDGSGQEKVHVGGDGPFRKLPRLGRLLVQGKADESEVVGEGGGADSDGAEEGGGKKKAGGGMEKKKMRGKGKALKRYLRKKRKNVIDPSTVALRARMERQREEGRKERERAKRRSLGGGEMDRRPSALERFRRA